MTTLSMGLWNLPAHVGASRGTLDALRREFARLRSLEHPHIARLLELGSNGQQYYVTGERLDGESLREVLAHLLPERLDVKDADEIVRAIGSALVYSHAQGIAHGDVRAENVLVTMDQRFVLTNFLARRIAKVTARPPRPSDDLRGLARLAAELYTGSTAPQALRDAVHTGVPTARLNAIRGVLEGPNRRSGDVAAFLVAAGLPPHAQPPPPPTSAAAARPAAPPRTKAARNQRRPWPFWRIAISLAAGLAIGSALASYDGLWPASVDEFEMRSRDALRAVAARMAPPQSPIAPSVRAAPEPRGAAPLPAADPVLTPAPESVPAPAATTAPAATQPQTTAAAAKTAPAPRSAPTLSLGVARIAAREDHSVVAIDIVRTGDTSRATAVDWWITADTAHEDEDYVTTDRQTVAIPAGVAVGRILIPIVNDGIPEAEESFTVHLGRPRGAAAGAASTTQVTLHDDD